MERELAAWVLVVILNKTATIGLKEKIVFEERLECNEEANQVDILQNSVLGRQII